MRIEVTQEHIDNGDCGRPTRCPIALALKEVLPNQDYIGVTYRTCGDDDIPVLSTGTGEYDLPIECADFMFTFDTHREVKPFSFDFELPTGVSP